MKREIRITKKKGEDGHKIVSVRMREDTLKKLDELAEQTNRSRNELINLRLAEYLAARGDRLDYDTSSSYGDSASDLNMLELSP